MKKVFSIFFSSFLLFFTLIIYPSDARAQYGEYSCFRVGSGGGCQAVDTCSNGGRVPVPNQCQGLPSTSCNSSSTFSCDGPSGEGCYGTPCPDGQVPFYPDAESGGGGSICICVAEGAPGTIPDVIHGPPLTGGCISTAIGCIPVLDKEGNEVAAFFLTWGMGIAGGIALVMIGISSFMIMTAAGDPRKLQGGKELLTAAVSGLLLLVFSAFILRFAGQDILGIF